MRALRSLGWPSPLRMALATEFQISLVSFVHDEVSTMRIYHRVAPLLIVILATVTASFAGDHRPTIDSGVGAVALTVATPPERRSVPERSSPVRDGVSREKTLALLLLMLKDGRGAR